MHAIDRANTKSFFVQRRVSMLRSNFSRLTNLLLQHRIAYFASKSWCIYFNPCTTVSSQSSYDLMVSWLELLLSRLDYVCPTSESGGGVLK